MNPQLIEPGSRAPAFYLPDQSGVRRRLSEFAGKTVILYFYPKDDTSSCTIEAQEFRDAAADFRRKRAVVIGISPDSVDSHCRFADKHRLTFILLADVPDERGAPKTCNRYGVWAEKQLYGRTYMGVVRTTYIIGPTGKVEHRFDRVRARGHACQVLDAVRAPSARTRRSHRGG